MGKWIRSQDKTILTNTKAVKLEPKYMQDENLRLVESGKYDIYDEEDCLLGIYENEERAMEILDEIQDSLCMTAVYEMPEE